MRIKLLLLYAGKVTGITKGHLELDVLLLTYLTFSCNTSLSSSIALSSVESFVPSSPRKALKRTDCLVCSTFSNASSNKLFVTLSSCKAFSIKETISS